MIMAKPTTIINPPAPPFLCEYSHKPVEECYCRHVTGRSVPNIALYCMERFRECPIYRKLLQQQTTGTGPDYTPREETKC